MTHNITTAHEASERHPAFVNRSVSDLPQSGTEEIWRNPVLTVTHNDGKSQASLLFHSGDPHNGGPQIVVNPWHLDHDGPLTRIEGEDLFALRELLNELPEHAFVRPAPPVEKQPAAWAPGDHITNTQYALDYVRVGDEWMSFGRDANSAWRCSDAQMDQYLKSFDYYVVRRRGGVQLVKD